MFYLKNSGHLLDVSERISLKLTFRYHSLAAFFFYDIGGITGASARKTADLQFSPKISYDKGASAARSRLTAETEELPANLEKDRQISKKFDPGCRFGTSLVSQ